MRVVVLFNLKPGVDEAAYEDWAKTRDVPGIRALPSIDDFRVYRTTGLMNAAGTPPYRYVELLDIADGPGFETDSASEAMQTLMREFADYADAPVIMTTEQVD